MSIREPRATYGGASFYVRSQYVNSYYFRSYPFMSQPWSYHAKSILRCWYVDNSFDVIHGSRAIELELSLTVCADHLTARPGCLRFTRSGETHRQSQLGYRGLVICE